MYTLDVRSESRPYRVHVGRNILARTGAIIREGTFARPGARCALVTDHHVAALYAENVSASLRTAGYFPSVVTVPAGETSKSMAEVARVADAMVDARLDRLSFIVARGGGVVGDLVGFVASIYYRGIPFVQVPTTVISQVDSAIGGKTGVNTPAGKNLLGTFYPPAAVIADVDTLDTLPAREFNEGFAEVIKHAVIRDRGLFDDLFQFERQGACDAMPGIIRRNLEIKAEVVAADEFERTGLRALLNFGHTVGHAVEQAAGYGRFLHGEAIAIGMVAAGRLSMELAGFPAKEFCRLVELLRHFSLPTGMPRETAVEPIMASLARDKKFEAAAVRFVLTSRIGEARLSEPGEVTTAMIRLAIERLTRSPDSSSGSA